ncbi:DNA excision repair protein ERCC-6-like 2 [Xyrichtys novacula]|uniref:DNA excision repair protein ERCC-6-like 2 n=1 Tax=Xyrichtys novacula TaxID=13765 RepID=A0AAV1G4T2_XYRNO|nr:DNA excision repair protein ERCC-6-like 2 [Xyrichtys novacula]
MAATSVDGKATWHEGDRCLAPDPRDGSLREATISRLTSTPHEKEDDTAWVVFNDDGKNEEEEEAVPVSKLVRPDLNHFNQEKPVFPSSITAPRSYVPLELSDFEGDSVPYTINRYLRDYQREGIRFIYNNYIRSRGCILGDDMGLGKTVQVIGYLAAVLHKTGTWEDVENNRPQFLQSQKPSKPRKPNKVFLIVAPLSVLYNWKDELETWGHFQCVVVHGLKKEEELARIKKGRTEIALTTYETLRLCLDQFNNIDWSAVIVDEAHKIKNPNSQITQAMKDLTCKIRIGLTGTILQNNLEELWCVMDWAIPGCLGSLGHFKNKFSDPIEQGQRHSATKRTLATGRKAVRALVKKISHFFLRRTKGLIKDQLPKKDDRVVYCSLTDFQQTVYQTVLDSEDVTLMLRSSEKCDCHSGRTRRRCCYSTNSSGVQIKTLYFSYLAILRKVSSHVALLQSTAGTSKKQEKYIGDICKKVFQKFPEFVQRCKDEAFEALSDPMYSGKMKVLEKLLKFYLGKRDKVLLFSLSTKLLDVLESYCMAAGLDYSRLDGATKSKERVQIVKDFNSSPHINLCLVSTMAGGLGLNFVGANVVVLFDPTWNPANDLQAIDRAYRIGQCRDVTVLRLISLGTVEEVIYLRQVYKQQLQSSVVGKESARRYFEAVQGHDVYKGELFGIKNLFRLQTEGTCLTRMILEREGQVESGVMTTSTHTGEEKEEEVKGASELDQHPSTDPPVTTNEPAIKDKDMSNDPKGVLDFSSGSEMDEEEQGLKRKVSNPTAMDLNKEGNSTTSPGRMSLLQHGFSKLLERVKGKPESCEGDSSPAIEESSSEEDDADKKREGVSSICKSPNTGEAACVTKVDKKTRDTDEEDGDEEKQKRVSLLKQSDEAARKRQDLKERVDKRSLMYEEKDKKDHYKQKATVSSVHQVKNYSDESEDLDMGTVMRPKSAALNSHSRQGDHQKGRKRQSASVRDKARSKHTENIETFTSSEDEHTPVKKGRSTQCSLKSPQTERSRAGPKKAEETAGTSSRTEKTTETPKAVTFTNLKSQRSQNSKGKDGTIDTVLGGVQEVVYTHSNQRVVGGSKAEELISRAAVRDVFDRKMYSQLPANHLLGTLESLSESPPDSPPYPSSVRLEKPRVEHPVTFTNKSTHNTRHTTFIIGETPRAICRQQLEEMAEKTGFSSAQQFAEEILRGKSTQRLAWLRQFYTSLDQPGLADVVRKNFPQPDAAQATSSPSPASTKVSVKEFNQDTGTQQNDVPKAKRRSRYTKRTTEAQTKLDPPQNNVSVPQKKSRRSQQNDVVQEPRKKQNIQRKNALEPLSDFSSPETEEDVCSARGYKRTKRGSVSTSGAFRTGGGLGLDQASSSGLGSRETAAFLNRTHSDTPSSTDLSHGRSTTMSKPTAQGREQEQKLSSRSSDPCQDNNPPPPPPPPEKAKSTSSHRSFLTDLIGDTSVLDDLFKPKPRSTPKTPPTPTSASGSKHLTTPSPSGATFKTKPDPAESLSSLKSNTSPTHQTVSKSSRKDFWDILNEGNEESINRLTDLEEVQRVCIDTNLAAKKRTKEQESKSLWKTNDKFLWKK